MVRRLELHCLLRPMLEMHQELSLFTLEANQNARCIGRLN